jgi:predicted dehydrogenase
LSLTRICLVGCGGMGSRHVNGYAALEGTGLSNVALTAVCDVRRDNAEQVAAEAERALGHRPDIYLSVEDALADQAADAYDVVTDASTHLPVVLPLLEAGQHVLSEKPLALTVRSGQRLIDAAEASGAILATAENYRRDPCNRLAKAVIDSGLLGQIFLLRQVAVGGSDRILITPWRHLKDKGAIGLDMGVHFTDLFQYYLGPFESVFGHGFIAEPVRYRQEKLEFDSAAYTRRHAEIPERITATGEDSVVATYTMRSGVTVQLAYIPSGPGTVYEQRTVHGRAGSLEIFKDRSGRAPILHRADGDVTGRELADAAGGLGLGPVTERLFGDGIGYDLPFAEVDAGLLAIEIHDFAAAIQDKRVPEVDGRQGLTSVAALLAAYESGLTGGPVPIAAVLDGTVAQYQADIDAGLGLLLP